MTIIARLDNVAARKPRDAMPAKKPAHRSIVATLARLIGWTALLVCAGVAAGFVWFASRIPQSEIALDRNADGIVVLTGGASRVADAVELLAAGRGKRLLISGVNRVTTAGEIARLVPQYEELFKCCVDLDRSAINTLGNAVETRRWAQGQGFGSLIVVTSNYHLPRSMVELSRQLPGIALVPFPVVSERLRTEPWWSSAPAFKLLFVEYLKYVLAQAQIRLEPPGSSSGLAGPGAQKKG